MGKYLDKFKKGAKKGVKKADQKIKDWQKDEPKKKDFGAYDNAEGVGDVGDYDDTEGYDESAEDKLDNYGEDNDRYDDMGIPPAQKPESFHHFILENQYKDLERSIRGFKDVYDKEKQQWVTMRKKEHCFTDEESEEILRTAQSHLATDIKLGRINVQVYGALMDALYQEIAFIFESIAEYRYGRYNSFTKEGVLTKVNFEKQYEMKLQNHKIFLELFTRIEANYSRAIGGMENKMTHESVQGQESLQGGGEDPYSKKRYS